MEVGRTNITLDFLENMEIALTVWNDASLGNVTITQLNFGVVQVHSTPLVNEA